MLIYDIRPADPGLTRTLERLNRSAGVTRGPEASLPGDAVQPIDREGGTAPENDDPPPSYRDPRRPTPGPSRQRRLLAVA